MESTGKITIYRFAMDTLHEWVFRIEIGIIFCRLGWEQTVWNF